MIYIDYVIYHVRDEFYKMVSFITGLKARVFSQRIRNLCRTKKPPLPENGQGGFSNGNVGNH